MSGIQIRMNLSIWYISIYADQLKKLGYTGTLYLDLKKKKELLIRPNL